MKKKSVFVAILITLGLLLAFFVGLSMAQEPVTGTGASPESPTSPDARSNYIPIQGRVTNASGVPLDGYYDITFRLYNDYSGGTPLCADTNNVSVDGGLFSTLMYAVGCPIDGRRLYLGVEVESDGEMTPRQQIGNVPMAWSLRPGANISDTLSTDAILDLENWGATGRGLRSYAMDASGTNYGIVGASRSSNGYGGYFYNNGGGVGLHAWTNAAAGVGVIAEGFDSGPDLVLGGNADTTTGDDGILSSDPDLVSSDIVMNTNDNVRIDLDFDGNDTDSDFEIRADGVTIFNVDDSGAISMGTVGVAAFPRPAYDSGWVEFGSPGCLEQIHNLYGNVDNYVIDLQVKLGTNTTNSGVGGDNYYASGDISRGAIWQQLDTNSIELCRWFGDVSITHIRARIWMYP